jgi:hypothetical protein
LSSTTALPSPADRHHSLTYETHPLFGDYIYSPTIESWTQRRQMSDGRPLLLCGRGRRPTDEQIALFQQIDVRLPELTASAIAVIEPPPIKPPRVWLKRPPEFTRDELVLREVRIEEDLTFELFFDTPTGDRIDMWPLVEFRAWEVAGTEWAC